MDWNNCLFDNGNQGTKNHRKVFVYLWCQQCSTQWNTDACADSRNERNGGIMGGYQSVYDIYSIGMWLIGLVAAFLVGRTGRDIYAAMSDEDLGLKGAIKKVKKRITAAVIAVTIEGLVTFFRQFYQ